MKNPKLIAKPFAKNGQKNVIPENYETSMESNQATWDQGFGQITMLPVAAGGLPPKGQDFNGIFNQISENIVYLSQGGRFKFSAEYAEAIGGYPKGAILQSDDEKKEYLSLIDNNKVDFNTAVDISASWKLVNTDDLLSQIASKQPKGDYATKTELNSGLAGKQPTGDYATKTEVGSKLDKAAVVQTPGASTTEVISQKAITDLLAGKVNFDDIVMELSDDWYKVPSVNLLDKELKKKASNTALTEGLAGKVDNATFSQEMTKKADKSSLGTAAGKNTGNSTGQIPDMSHFPFSGKGTDSIVVTLPNGLIIQSFKREVLSSVNVGESNAISINFPAAFPNKVIAVVCTKSSYVQIAISCENKTLSGFSAVAMKVVPADVTYSMADFIVLGY